MNNLNARIAHRVAFYDQAKDIGWMVFNVAGWIVGLFGLMLLGGLMG